MIFFPFSQKELVYEHASEEVLKRIQKGLTPGEKRPKKLAGEVKGNNFVFKENSAQAGGQRLWTKGQIKSVNGLTKVILRFAIPYRDLAFMLFWTVSVGGMTWLLYADKIMQSQFSVELLAILIALLFGYSLVVVPYYLKRSYLKEYIDQIVLGKKQGGKKHSEVKNHKKAKA
jgi:hypothetical protein